MQKKTPADTFVGSRNKGAVEIHEFGHSLAEIESFVCEKSFLFY